MWNLGDRDDVINDDWGSTGQGAINRLVLGPGILPTDVTSEAVPSSSYHIKFVIRQNGVVSGSVTINYWTYIYSGPQHKDTWRLDFSNGVTWNATTLATSLSDILNGTSFADTLNGAAGADTLNGLDGEDTLSGGIGNDTLNGETGNDTLSGDSDNDTLNGGTGYDSLNGGTGNDTLNGGAGNDSYIWNLGDGDDVINDDWGSTGQSSAPAFCRPMSQVKLYLHIIIISNLSSVRTA
jgi:Ca2+-binding RTX toxin-like protein